VSNNVNNYGWKSVIGPHSCNYIAPFILAKIDSYAPKRIIDLGSGSGSGSGNGNLCNLINKKLLCLWRRI
jgi:hypothetical protein